MKAFVVPSVAALTIVATAIGCDRTPEKTEARELAPAPATEPKPATSAAAPVTPAAEKEPDEKLGITWKDPAGWTRLPQRSPMRIATYRVPKKGTDGEDSELAVFYFGSNSGGGVDANMKRWAGQFSDVPESQIVRSERTANDLTQHVMEIPKGTFSSGMPMGPSKPMPNYGMLAAIVESPSGLYFFKLTGPAETVKSARADFLALLDSVRATDR